jgi:hypothetical protein
MLKFFPVHRYAFYGLFLLILGFFLLPFGIGLLIMPVGAIFIVIGTYLSIWSLIPGHKSMEPKIKDFASRYIDSSNILKAVFKRSSKI